MQCIFSESPKPRSPYRYALEPSGTYLFPESSKGSSGLGMRVSYAVRQRVSDNLPATKDYVAGSRFFRNRGPIREW